MKAISVALLAGIACCALFQSASVAKAAQPKMTVVHSFGLAPDGSIPWAGLTNVGGTLYGMTQEGGANGYYGAVFAINPDTGAESILYSFCSKQNCTDGQWPEAGVIGANGKLYGTTTDGGANSAGVAFALNPKTGAETVLHTFGNGADGQYPDASLLAVKGTLYGTTAGGGAFGYGTVYAIDANTGAETVLYSFAGGNDGAAPLASLIDVNGTLYGTTSGGSVSNGTVFSFDPSTGVEKVLYAFCSRKNCADGATPYANLIDVNGTLYGTTFAGGASNNGTVFSLNPGTGAETVVYSFAGGSSDGAGPFAGVIDVKDTLYGTTMGGGGTGCNGSGCGTVFAVNANSGAETVIHFFCKSCAQEGEPSAGLVSLKGVLYGDTRFGGHGNGTVFSITNP